MTVEASAGSPLGPWTPLGTRRLERDADGAVAPMALDAPVWARFVRFSARGPRTEGAAWELPGRISVFERPRMTRTAPSSPSGARRDRRVRPSSSCHRAPRAPSTTRTWARARTRGRLARTSAWRAWPSAATPTSIASRSLGPAPRPIAVEGQPVVGVRVRSLDADGIDVLLAFSGAVGVTPIRRA
ncbi:MAG: hypothetical protein R3C32_13935 [Chloroflexota bacterium]